MTATRTTTPAPFRVPADFIRYAVALRAAELCRGYLTGWLSAEDTVELAFLRRCDLAEESGPFTRIKQATAAKTQQLAAVCSQLDSGDPDTERIWDYLALAWACSHPPAEATRLLEALSASRLPLAKGTTHDPEEAGRAWLTDGRREFLLDRAAAREGMNWDNSSALLGTDRPEEVDAAFSRREDMAGVAVIGLALTHPDPTAILPRVARALESSDQQLQHQGVVALAHVARLHRTTDPRCLELLRSWPRGNEADDDLWAYLPHRRLPPWLWRHKTAERLVWQLRNRWH